MNKLLLKNKEGQTIIEFALLLPILLMVLFGIIEFGRAMTVINLLNTASREGARLAVPASFSESDTLSVMARVEQILDAANIDAKEIKIEFSRAEENVKVTVTTDFEVLTGGILDPFMGVIPLKGTTVTRKWYNPE